jgi:hypothetical protein
MGEEETLTLVQNNMDNQIEQELNSIEPINIFDEEVLSKVFKIENEFLRHKVIMSLENKAKSIGQTRNLQKLLKVLKVKYSSPKQVQEETYTLTVPELGLVLNTGEWLVDNMGVRRYTEKGETLIEEQASWHLVFISNIFYNTEQNTYKVQLAFRENEFSKLKTITVNKSTISNTSNITCLADYGISVTNHSAPFLVKYLNDLERLNVDTIPRSASISRIGWINDYGFIPYTDDISFDGETIYGELYNAIDSKGSYDEWKTMVLGEQSLQARVALATSFASPLVSIMDSLCFFTHMWGSSGTGKSVSLHLAQSVWGNPMKLVQNLNSTAVGLERLAGFFCNLPLCLDELQTLKKTFGGANYDDILYRLGQGKGKNRGRKDGSIERVPTWSMAIITNGEEPITNEKSGAGAKNRVLDIYCNGNVFNNAPNVAKVCHQNYGFAGKEFIDKLKGFIKTHSIKPLNELYDKFYTHILSYRTTEKQAMSATMVGLGYALMKHFIFNEPFEQAEKIGLDFLTEISSCLVKIDEINNIEEMYDNIISFVAQNKHHFIYKTSEGFNHNPIDNKLDTWGRLTDTTMYITNSIFNKYCEDNNLSYRKTIRLLFDKGYLNAVDEKHITSASRINDSIVRCIAVFRNKKPENTDLQVQMRELNVEMVEVKDELEF